MSRSSGSPKMTEWRRRLRRFSQSKLTVVAFCEKERVSVPSFYHWRRKLSAASKLPRRKQNASSSFRSVAVVTSGPAVSVTFAGGTRIEIPPGNMEAVRAVVGELVRTDLVGGSGDSSC